MESKEINLSYFMTTFNKLPYLKIVVGELIKNRQDDEEIIIVDGGSKDGSIEWLQQLYAENKIQYFFSGDDKGEAHGVNRAMLECRGKILKWINDDDIFCYPAIKECKNFMLQNAAYDFLGADGFDNYMGADLAFVTRYPNYIRWKQSREPFGFYGPGVMMRKTSLPLLGLCHSISRFVDNEYTYRATCLPIQMVWYLKPLFVRVINPQSNTLKFLKAMKSEQGLNDIYRKIATGRSVLQIRAHRAFSIMKQNIYNTLHRKSTIMETDKFQFTDLSALYHKHTETLVNAYQNCQGEAFSV
jgi:glycosyltransferase involved in cell wall biosynthesis